MRPTFAALRREEKETKRQEEGRFAHNPSRRTPTFGRWKACKGRRVRAGTSLPDSTMQSVLRVKWASCAKPMEAVRLRPKSVESYKRVRVWPRERTMSNVAVSSI